MLAYLGDTAFVGVPGAAVKAPTTTFDVLLPPADDRGKADKDGSGAAGGRRLLPELRQLPLAQLFLRPLLSVS